jgi:hypothetical protein
VLFAVCVLLITIMITALHAVVPQVPRYARVVISQLNRDDSTAVNAVLAWQVLQHWELDPGMFDNGTSKAGIDALVVINFSTKVHLINAVETNYLAYIVVVDHVTKNSESSGIQL